MDEFEIHAHELSEEQRTTFRRAAGERGAAAVVDWEGRPHLVNAARGRDEDETFVLEPIPRTFG